jgi:general secretion pathway protein D
LPNNIASRSSEVQTSELRTNDRSVAARIAPGYATLCAIVLSAAGWLHGAPSKPPSAAKEQKQSTADNKQAKPPAQAPPPVEVCPDGQPKRTMETPFGPMKVCPEAGAAPAPAQPPAPSGTAQPPAPSSTAPSMQKPATGDVQVVPGAAQPPAEGKPQAGTVAAPEATQPPKTENPPSTAPLHVEPSGPDGAVALNLENADLFQVLRILGQELKINYIVDPQVKGSVTINTSGSVTRKDLFSLLQMILNINGAVAVKSNGYYSIVPLGNAKQQPMNFSYAKEAEAQPAPEDAFSLLVVPMKFMSAAEMSKILTPFMSPAGQIVVQDKGNIMLITESAAKLKQLRDIVNVFDDPVLGRSRVRLFPVTNNLAQNLVVELKSVFAGYGLSTGNSAIQFIPMERLNSILAISPSPEVFPEVEDWIKKLDQPAREVGLRNFVYKVQNAKASELKQILSELYGGSPARETSASSTQNPFSSGTSTPENPATVMGPISGMAQQPGGGTASTGPRPETGGGRVQGELRIMSDDKNNAIIIQATQHDYEIVQRTLQELDILPRQVLIDARIYEVDLTGDLSLGISAFIDRQSKLGDLTSKGSFSPGQTGGSLQAQTFAILSNTKALQLFLTADENRSRIKTLSAPSILVTDNTSARIQVGSEVPVPIGSSLTPVQSGGSSLFAQTIQFRDTGVILTVTPRINASGIVTLTLAQEVSSAQPNTTSAIVAPVISKSQFQTQVVLRDGQTLALGGIISTSDSTSRTRIPIIGDIPGLGLLFGSTSMHTARKELVLLITPHVALDIPESSAITDEFVSRLRNLKKEMKKAVVQPQPPPPQP